VHCIQASVAGLFAVLNFLFTVCIHQPFLVPNRAVILAFSTKTMTKFKIQVGYEKFAIFYWYMAIPQE